MRARSLLLIVLLLAVGAAAVALASGPDRRGARVIAFAIDSRAVHRREPQRVVVPAGAAANPPLLIFLHGRGGNERSELSSQFFAALAKLGPRAPVVAFPDGGFGSYWHDRRGGRWARYVMGEVIPQVQRRFHTDPRRIAIGGISMGGFGAYDLARTHPGRFCAAGGHSPALWRTSGQTAPGAFDDGTDFARHDVIAVARRNPAALTRSKLWLDAGTADPFLPGDGAFTRALRGHITVRHWPGGHDGAYWNAHWGDYLGFYARALAAC
ncbi:MAG: hypothetical protein QOE28_2740 [Solirubrobacteraceae bacterium]|jgi:S-formylglutathione hydrolase FrmB|nr:hypothetical protein [Solirubrobacteraceae bacterium]